jgi:NADH-quinone oxidoreductase subunit N
MNIAAFTVVAQLERPTGVGGVTDLRGLGRTAPGTAAALTLALLSLAGFPPLAGFAGKVLLFTPSLSAGLSWLAVFAALNMVVGLYYYLRPIAEMYLQESQTAIPLHRQPGYPLALWLCTAGTLLLGISPAPVLALMSRLAILAR